MGAKILCTQADMCVGFGDKNTLNLCGACKTDTRGTKSIH